MQEFSKYIKQATTAWKEAEQLESKFPSNKREAVKLKPEDMKKIQAHARKWKEAVDKLTKLVSKNRNGIGALLGLK